MRLVPILALVVRLIVLLVLREPTIALLVKQAVLPVQQILIARAVLI